MKGHLFIGGPADGEWRAIPGDPDTCRIATRTMQPLISPEVGELDYHHVTYRRETFKTYSAGTIVFYVSEDLSLWDATVRLFDNYRPEK